MESENNGDKDDTQWEDMTMTITSEPSFFHS